MANTNKRTASDILLENGYENVIIFQNDSYDDALIGVSEDNRAIYSYAKMIKWLVDRDGITDEEAMEWIDYNTIRAIPYAGEKAPIVMYDLV